MYCNSIFFVIYFACPRLLFVLVEGCIVWNDSKSLVLSKVFVITFMVLLLVIVILAPGVVAPLIKMSALAYSVGRAYFLATVYSGCVPIALLLVCLYILLQRMSAGSVFVKENVACLRYISWCCFAGAIICFVSALYYVPWLAVGAAAAFMGLIVRVIKNVFAKAVSLQNDADLTI